MKVLHVIPSVGPARGGPSFVIRTLTKGLAGLGMEVDVATTDDNAAAVLDVPVGQAVEEGGVRFRYFRRMTRPYVTSPGLARWLAGAVAGYDLVHLHAVFSFAPVAGGWAARKKRVPYVIRPLGVLNRWGMENRRAWGKKVSFALVEGPLIARAAGMHYTSEQERIEAESLGIRTKAYVIPNPVDSIGEVGSRDEFFRQRPELAGSPLVVFLSRIDRKKGIDLLIPAFRKVLERFAKAKLLMAGSGDGEYEQEMRRKTQELGIAGSVEWLGFTDGAAKRNLFAAADLFVLPSYSENFGVAVIEAMAAGLPVVVTDQVGICGFVEKERAGLVVECDVEQIAGAIGRVLASEERQEMGRRAAAAATAFTPARVASQVAEMYSTILRERASQ